MQLANGIPNRGEFLMSRLDQQQPFRTRFHLSLPSINRLDMRNDVYACCQLMLDEMLGNFAGLVLRSRGREDDCFIGHIKSAISSEPPAFRLDGPQAL